MCGIVGIFAHGSRAQPVDRWELVKMRDRMAARGPDGAGEWIAADSRVGFGHRRLSIIDPDERASQPMLSADGRLVITFNGEIYNYQALREELKAAGAALRTTSDTEVLLHLYARYGAEMVRRLRGMFTFGIWDEAKQRLLLARDPYGIKPLYTADAGGTFRFASQVKALLAGGGISGAVDPAGVTAFHLFGSVPEPFTLYRDIRALPAGHIQWVDKAGPRTSEPFANLAGILADGREQGVPPAAELPARVRAAVGDSVRAHLVADVEVGSFLSAGVDSGAVLGLMRDAQQRRIRAITLAFDEYEGTPQDEAPLAARVAAQYGVEHIVRRIGKREFEDDLPAILDAMDQPSIDGIPGSSPRRQKRRASRSLSPASVATNCWRGTQALSICHGGSGVMARLHAFPGLVPAPGCCSARSRQTWCVSGPRRWVCSSMPAPGQERISCAAGCSCRMS
jgi:asparagine synthase (glutamine-hydrolysing)